MLSYLNKKGAIYRDEKTVKEVLCSLHAKKLNINDRAESEENGIANLRTADVVDRKPVKLDKDVQPSKLKSQQESQGIISNPLLPARTGSPPPFSVYTPTLARIINTIKDPLCSPLLINLVNSQLTQLENKLCGNIMTMKSYFMDELRSKRAAVINCTNKTKDPISVDVKVSELQSKIGILEAEIKLLKESCSNKQKLLEVVLVDAKITGNDEISDLESLTDVHLQNPKNRIFSYNNINSIRNKFGSLCRLISSHVDILSNAKTKLYYSFPNAQFLISNFYHPFCLDINRNSEVLLVFVRSSFQQECYLIICCHLIFKQYHLKLI